MMECDPYDNTDIIERMPYNPLPAELMVNAEEAREFSCEVNLPAFSVFSVLTGAKCPDECGGGLQGYTYYDDDKNYKYGVKCYKCNCEVKVDTFVGKFTVSRK